MIEIGEYVRYSAYMDIEAVQSKIAGIAQKHGLDFVVLFGSQATGKTHPKSDIDIGIISKVPFDINRLTIDFYYDVFKREDVEVVDLSSVSSTLMRAVVRDGKLLYERTDGLFMQWKLYAIKIWMETAWMRKVRDRKLVEWAERHR